MGTPADVKARATASYTAAADRYDDPANAFWARFGRRTVERLGLSPRARGLDLASRQTRRPAGNHDLGPRFFEPASSASGLTGVEANVVYAVARQAGAGS